MKALPSRFTEEEHVAQADPTGAVKFTIRPLSNRVRSYIQTASTNYEKEGGAWQAHVDGGGAAYDTVGFGLIKLDGLSDGEKPFELKTVNVKMGKATIKRVTDESLDRIPALLFEEIQAAINIASMPTGEEVESVNFTPPSSPETISTSADPVPGMSQPVLTDALLDSPSADTSKEENTKPIL
jgi:hypothetical protein